MTDNIWDYLDNYIRYEERLITTYVINPYVIQPYIIQIEGSFHLKTLINLKSSVGLTDDYWIKQKDDLIEEKSEARETIKNRIKASILNPIINHIGDIFYSLTKIKKLVPGYDVTLSEEIENLENLLHSLLRIYN